MYNRIMNLGLDDKSLTQLTVIKLVSDDLLDVVLGVIESEGNITDVNYSATKHNFSLVDDDIKSVITELHHEIYVTNDNKVYVYKIYRSLFIEEDEDIILGDSVRLSCLEADGSFYLSGKVNEILGSLKILPEYASSINVDVNSLFYKIILQDTAINVDIQENITLSHKDVNLINNLKLGRYIQVDRILDNLFMDLDIKIKVNNIYDGNDTEILSRLSQLKVYSDKERSNIVD